MTTTPLHETARPITGRPLTASERYPGLMLPVGVIRLGGKYGGTAIVDPEDYEAAGALSWFVNAVSGNVSRQRYAMAWIPGKGKRETLQQFLTGNQMTGHISGDTMDCRRVNLCPLDHTIKQAGYGLRQRPDKTSRFKGVSREPCGGWRARIEMRKRRINLGTYPTEERAARAYDAKLIEIAGAYAMTNERLGLYAVPPEPPVVTPHTGALASDSRAIVAAVETAIRGGRLRPGDALARDLGLGVHLNGQARAYALRILTAKNLIILSIAGYAVAGPTEPAR